MTKWDGKSKGSPLGYKIYLYLIKKIGIRFAYFILYFLAFYYLLFSREGTRASMCYFNKRLGYSKFRSFFKSYKNNYVFGQTIIDKFVIKSGFRNKYTYDFDGGSLITDLLKEKKGGILISAHVGNFEIAEYFFNEIDDFSQINLVTTDNEHQAIKEQLDKFNTSTNIKFILIKNDLSHIFEINNALKRNELICFTGDRYFEGTKTLKGNLLGKEASFPAGPFLLGSRLKVPVLFVYVMKETAKHYHLYSRRAIFKNRDANDLLNNYIKSMETVLKKYPYQWFNFFDFWNDEKEI